MPELRRPLHVVSFECENKIKDIFLVVIVFACTPSVEYQMPLNDYYPSFHSYLPLNIINWNADTLLNERCELKTITSERNWLEPLNAINEDTVDFFSFLFSVIAVHQTKWKVKLCGKYVNSPITNDRWNFSQFFMHFFSEFLFSLVCANIVYSIYK